MRKKYIYEKAINKNTKLKNDSIIIYLFNFSCQHDIILKNFVMPDDVLKLLPYPKGDYMVQLGFAAYNQWIISVKAFVKVAD